jgi:ATP-binding cassette subfamily F protein uup
MLADYDGTVILVSHDRAFLDGVATQIVGPIGDGRWAETPGGWSDFEREHGGASSRLRPQRKQEAPRAMQARPRQPAKLSYKEERRAAELDTLLPALHAEIARLESKLSEPEAFVRDASAFSAAASRLEQARAELAAAEAEWLEIELKREQLAVEE